MIRQLTLCILGLIILVSSHAEARRRRPWEELEPKMSLGYTHIIPSTSVIPHLQLVLGTTSGIGLFDIFDVTTNLYLDLQGIFNVAAKGSVFNTGDFALALFGGYGSQQVKVKLIDPATNREITQYKNTSYFQPGGTFSYRIMPFLTGHASVSTVIRSPSISKSDLPSKTAFVQGTTVNKEFSYGINKNVVVSGGGSYDLTYSYMGLGASVHVGSFQVGLHVYPGVSEGAILPVLAGGYATDL